MLFRKTNYILRQSSVCLRRYLSTTLSNDNVKDHYDVIIAGGGLVGVSLAVSLGKFKNFLLIIAIY
jgi:NADH dehydrogenase FAD-containing subunit